MRGSREVGTWGVRTTPSRTEKHKAVNFLQNTGLEPLEKHKATDVRSMIIGPLAMRHLNAADGPMVARFGYWV